MVKSKTRRNGGSNRKKNYMTIPEIKTAFDEIEQATYRILREGGTTAEQVKKFQTEWKAIFHRPVRADSAEAYLKIKQVAKKRPNKTRKQKGGAAAPVLAGAPLDYATRPGISGNGHYGSFLQYQTMGAAPPPPAIAMDADCGIKDISPSVASLEAAQTGGSFGDFVHKTLLSPGEQSVPSSPGNNLATYLDGKAPAASPAAYQPALKM